MISKLPTQQKSEQGFALLITLVVISVVLAIGLSLLSISVKQFTLSATIRDSELAFHAANAGAECMQAAAYQIDLFSGTAPNPLPVNCTGGGVLNLTLDDSETDVYQYSGEYAWAADSQSLVDTVCTQIDLFMLDDSAGSGGITFDFAAAGYGLDTETCGSGNVCGYIFARGYNRPCNDLAGLRVVQRELTLSF